VTGSLTSNNKNADVLTISFLFTPKNLISKI